MKILRFMLVLFMVILPSLACIVSRTRQPALVFPSDTPTDEIVPTATTNSPTLVPTPLSLLPGVSLTLTYIPPVIKAKPTQTSTPQPYCTVLINVRLRSGPGIDFDHLTTLYAGDLFIPFAYVPQGRTEGAWVKVRLSNNPDRVGWVIASANAIACNLDITLLPPP